MNDLLVIFLLFCITIVLLVGWYGLEEVARKERGLLNLKTRTQRLVVGVAASSVVVTAVCAMLFLGPYL